MKPQKKASFHQFKVFSEEDFVTKNCLDHTAVPYKLVYFEETAQILRNLYMSDKVRMNLGSHQFSKLPTQKFEGFLP